MEPSEEDKESPTLSSILTLALESSQNIVKAVDRFFREAPQGEVRRFQPLWKKVEKGGLRQTHEGQFTAEWKWVSSLIAWDAYRSGNQEQALETLHEWLDVDCAFSFGNGGSVNSLLLGMKTEKRERSDDSVKAVEGDGVLKIPKKYFSETNILWLLWRSTFLTVAIEKHAEKQKQK